MPRWYGLRFASALLVAIMVIAVIDNFITRPDAPWYVNLRGAGLAMVVLLALLERRRWSWWLMTGWYALAAATFAAVAATPEESDSSPWLLALLSALSIVGFLAMLNGRDELSPRPAPEVDDGADGAAGP